VRKGILQPASWLALTVLLGATAWITVAAHRDLGERATARLQRQAARTADGLEARFDDGEALLRSLEGLFAASDAVTAAEWSRFIDRLARGPLWGSFEAVAAIEAPPGRGIVFQEPLPGGEDDVSPILVDAVSKLSEAWEGRRIPRPVVLAAGDGTELLVLAHGVLKESPPGDAGDPPDLWFAVALPVDQLVREVLGNRDPDVAVMATVDRENATAMRAASVPPSPGPAPAGPWPERILEAVPLANGVLELAFSPVPGFEIRQGSRRPWWILAAGLVISGFAFVVLQTFARIHDRAVALAAEMTRVQSETLGRYRAHLEQTPLAAVEWDAGRRITSWNPAAARVFGHSAGEALNHGVGLLAPDEGGSSLAALLERIASDGIGRDTLTVARRDGRPVVTEWYGTAITGDDGRLTAIATLADDVTEQVELQDRLRHSQKMDAVGRLAGGIAHDFNNILTAILGHADLVLMQLPAGDEARRHVEMMRDSASRAADLTQQLLAFSRRQVRDPRQLDPARVVTGVVPMLRRLIGENIELVTRLPPEPWPVVADRSQLEQVLVNLAVNARDAMPTGGRLELRVGTLAGTDGAEDRVELVVADTGVGMDRDTVARIFEPFFTTKERGRGTGLGLATVYGIVDGSGGTIEVESRPGAGSTFRILLPRATGEPADAAGPSTGSARGSDLSALGAEILLVEDDPAVRELTADMLTTAGYRVREAPDAEAALRLLEAHPARPDLVLSDVVLPGRTGADLARNLRRRWPDLKVVFMSGYPEDALGRHGVLDDGVELIQKPFTAAILLERLGTVLRDPAS